MSYFFLSATQYRHRREMNPSSPAGVEPKIISSLVFVDVKALFTNRKGNPCTRITLELSHSFLFFANLFTSQAERREMNDKYQFLRPPTTFVPAATKTATQESGWVTQEPVDTDALTSRLSETRMPLRWALGIFIVLVSPGISRTEKAILKLANASWRKIYLGKKRKNFATRWLLLIVL